MRRERAIWRNGILYAVVWLVYLAYPFSTLVKPGVSTTHRLVGMAGLVLFTFDYIGSSTESAGRECQQHMRWHFLLQLALALTLTALFGEYWAVLFVYTAASGGRLKPIWFGLMAVALPSALCALFLAALHDYGEMAILTVISITVGSMTANLSHQVLTDRQLHAAREEIARLATANERLRIARDMHDLLGHSLSVIALKADLAERLVPEHPKQAAHEMADVAAVARRSLTEVREAIAGYREMHLQDELARAQSGLGAAGIQCSMTVTTQNLPEPVDSALGWVLREAITNILRHSHAHNCRIEVRTTEDAACILVEDDGVGASPIPPHVGSGLKGLAERLGALGGSLHTGPGTCGGFSVRAQIPLGGAMP